MQKASLSRCSTPVRPSPQLCYHRRSVLVLPLLSPWLLITKQVEASPGGVDSMESPFVQELLRKTAEKKDERRAERLKVSLWVTKREKSNDNERILVHALLIWLCLLCDAKESISHCGY